MTSCCWIWLPDQDGLETLEDSTDGFSEYSEVVIISGHGTIEAAVRATKLAYDFLEKPLSAIGR
jgi:two-component system nitrogen regulation response regulator NtrX